MADKEMLTLPVIDQSVLDKEQSWKRWSRALQKVWLYLKGADGSEKRLPDPAAAVIAQIENREVARMVSDLHYRTPKSLKAMRKACESCFVLPDDCPYYDYSIFDVKKAQKRFLAQPEHIHMQVIAELRKVNRELAHHLDDLLE